MGSCAVRESLATPAAALWAVSSQGVFSVPTAFFQVWPVSQEALRPLSESSLGYLSEWLSV